jgi:hypothetical protein
MKEQAITVTDTEIVILAQFFVHKDYSITGKDLIMDVLGKHYTGQQIVIKLMDGENTRFSGFDQFIQHVSNTFDIPANKITFVCHDAKLKNGFVLDHIPMGIFVSVKQYLPSNFDRNVTQSRFVGCLLGRYNLNRLRLAYELDSAFPNDTFITFQPRSNFVKDTLKNVDLLYQSELTWIENKTFDKDLVSGHHMGMIDWYAACANYGNVWNQYQIEVVSETDAVDNFWFTEKTANCLATGKPFVLVSGNGSLARLRDMGFQTFDSVIDESYDLATHPYDRIKRLTDSLRVLYTSSSRQQQMDTMYQLASKNCELYDKYIQTVKKS